MTSPRAARYRLSMIGSNRIEGYAIISADGMIADAGGKMPDTIRNQADQDFLQAELDRAVAVVHGRHSHEGGPRAAGRKRVVVTRQVASLAPDPSHPRSLLWNPAGATFDAAINAIGVGSGTIAIIGGTEVFELFLPLYDAFHVRSPNAPEFPADGRCSRKSGRMQPRRMCSHGMACGLIRRATSTRQPGSR